VCSQFGRALALYVAGASRPKCLWSESQKDLVRSVSEPAKHNEETFVARLAQFFPNAIRVRIPISVYSFTNLANQVEQEGSGSKEDTVIEFGTAREVIFASALPLEFNDKVQLKNSDGSLDAQASVVAVQFGEKKSAVAVRFTNDVANWIIKPA
jgi:hypothetical protein